MERHIRPLTSLRFFAALGVFVFHTRAIGFDSPSFAAQGVSFFFILSGFILTYAHPFVPAAADFYRRRFARVWPVHVFSFLLVVILLPGTFSAGLAVLNLLLLHGWIPAGEFVFSFNAVSWSVSDEAFFYLLFPLLARSRRIAPALLIGGLAALAVVVAANRFWYSPMPWPAFGWIHLVLQNPLERCGEFVVGVALGRLFLGTRQQAPRWLACQPTAVEVAVVVLIGGNLALSHYSRFWTGLAAPGWFTGPATAAWLSQIGAAPSFALAILIFAYQRGRLSACLAHPALVLLGEISYATYMLHQIVLALAVRHALGARVGAGGTLALVITVTYLGSYAVWRWIEKPCRRRLAGSPVRPETPGPTS